MGAHPEQMSTEEATIGLRGLTYHSCRGTPRWRAVCIKSGVKNRRAGFTLIEVIVTVALTSVLLLGLFALLGASMAARNETRERDIAREAARATLEQVLATPFDLVEGTYGTTGNPTFFAVGTKPNQLTSSVAGELPLRVEIDTATAPASAGDDGLKRVIVQVRWVGADNRANTYELSSYMANRDE